MKTNQHFYKYYTYLITAFISCYLVSGFVLNRLISIDGYYYITGGTFIYFFSPIICDVVTEIYGYRLARQMLWAGIFAQFFMGICAALVIKAPVPSFWTTTDSDYKIVLEPLLRSCVSGFFAIFIGQFTNAYLISKWKILLKGKHFWLRSVASSFIGDSITVTIAILGIFIGRIPTNDLSHTLIPELIIMISFSLLATVPASLLARFLKKVENSDPYDEKVNFNPFKFGLSN